MFKKLAKQGFTVILVTGPQRAGTRIAAHCIAHDTGFRYVDETEFGTHNEKQFSALISKALKTSTKTVIHCPAMAHKIQAYGTDGVLVIFMLRELHEIQRSQERIGWRSEMRELLKYKRTTGKIAEVKYAYWLTHQRHRTRNWRELHYDSLKNHKLWRDPKLRKNFEVTQWQ